MSRYVYVHISQYFCSLYDQIGIFAVDICAYLCICVHFCAYLMISLYICLFLMISVHICIYLNGKCSTQHTQDEGFVFTESHCAKCIRLARVKQQQWHGLWARSWPRCWYKIGCSPIPARHLCRRCHAHSRLPPCTISNFRVTVHHLHHDAPSPISSSESCSYLCKCA